MTDLTAAYHERLASGALRADPAQVAALTILQDTILRLHDYQPARNGFMERLFFKPAPPPRGLYLHGSVGRGKSMLMDLFFAAAPVAKKRRVHFHQFMLEVHGRVHRLVQDKEPDLLPRIAREIAADTWLLCFDEFHVGNIADAMILGRLFEALFEEGVVVVATSNWAPDELYKNGLQRDRFLPFIALIQKHMNVYLLGGDLDHRFEQTRALPHYFHPLNGDSTHKLRTTFFQLTDNSDPQVIELPVQGRLLRLTRTAKEVGFFNFDELCKTALGAADYLALAENLHTIILDGVPRMTADRRNETTRFINLIDALYEAKAKLYMASETPIDQLAPDGELAFPFQRTMSRLMEMQGDEYLKKPHLGA